MSTPAETVRELYAAFARGDVAAVLALLDDDVRWITPTLPWSRGEYAGPAAVGEYFASFAAALENPAVEPRELLECGDRVIALGEERARVRSTGRTFAVPFAHAIRVRDDRVTEMRGHIDTAAIAASFDRTGG